MIILYVTTMSASYSYHWIGYALCRLYRLCDTHTSIYTWFLYLYANRHNTIIFGSIRKPTGFLAHISNKLKWHYGQKFVMGWTFPISNFNSNKVLLVSSLFASLISLSLPFRVPPCCAVDSESVCVDYTRKCVCDICMGIPNTLEKYLANKYNYHFMCLFECMRTFAFAKNQPKIYVMFYKTANTIVIWSICQ